VKPFHSKLIPFDGSVYCFDSLGVKSAIYAPVLGLTPMAPTALFALLIDAKKTVTAVNDACARKDLPPALTLQSSPLNLHGNPNYRFEGFGIVAGLKPKLSFWVHYKPGIAEHVQVGQFQMPFSPFKLPEMTRLVKAIAV